MRRTLSLLLTCGLAALTSCRTWSHQHYLGADDYLLASRDNGPHQRETYRLKVRGVAALRVETEGERERPFLGFKLVEIDKEKAERRGVLPYSGLLITGVYPQSAAELGGVLAGDVLLSIDGQALVYLQQAAVAESKLQGGKPVKVSLRRGQLPIDLELETKLLRERVVDCQDVPLEAVPPSPRPYAGTSLQGIPAVWCERMFGEARNAVVVSDVEVGSPAWVAGVRAGDVIDSVDGQPVPSAQELSQRIAELGAEGCTMRWRVRRGPGQFHDAEIHLSDYSGESNAWIPLVLYYRNGSYEDRWTVGPFGLLLSNRNTYLTDSSVRRPETRNVFSAVLGLLRVETTPHDTEVRLLWFIRFRG